MDKATIRKILEKLYLAYKRESKISKFPADQIFREIGVKNGVGLEPLWNSNWVSRDERENIYISQEGINYMTRVTMWYRDVRQGKLDGDIMVHSDKKEHAFNEVDKEVEKAGVVTPPVVNNIGVVQFHSGSGDNVGHDNFSKKDKDGGGKFWTYLVGASALFAVAWSVYIYFYPAPDINNQDSYRPPSLQLTYNKISENRNEKTGLYETRFLISIHRPPGNFETGSRYSINMPTKAECFEPDLKGNITEQAGGIASSTSRYSIMCTSYQPIIDTGDLFALK